MTEKNMTLTGKGMDSKGAKIKATKEVEQSAIHFENSPAKKKKILSEKSPTLNVSVALESIFPVANREVSLLFSKYAEVMSERAALDASQVRELESILKEARVLESHLRDKKEHLRQSLAVISDKLQG